MAEANPGCAKVSVVGEGMRGVPASWPGGAALHDAPFACADLRLALPISCLVPESDMERAAPHCMPSSSSGNRR